MKTEIRNLPDIIGTFTIMMKEFVPMKDKAPYIKYMAYLMYNNKKLTYIIVDYPQLLAGEWVYNHSEMLDNHTYHIHGHLYPETKWKDKNDQWQRKDGYIIMTHAQEKAPELPTDYFAVIPKDDINSDLPF